MKFCPECGGYLPTSPNFCNWCGFCLNKKCSSCANYSFSKYCIECGNHMVPSHTVLVKTEVNNVVLKNEQAYSEPIRENIKQTSDLNNNSKLTVENQDFNPEEDLKIKVNILKGDDMREIKLENGGGRRTVIMKKTDKFIDVLRKLREKYFPRNKFTSLGCSSHYIFTILDFKKDNLSSSARFINLERYLNENGLRVNQGPAFYLYLTSKPKPINNSTNFIKTENKSTNDKNEQLNTTLNKRASNANDGAENKKLKSNVKIVEESDDSGSTCSTCVSSESENETKVANTAKPKSTTLSSTKTPPTTVSTNVLPKSTNYDNSHVESSSQNSSNFNENSYKSNYSGNQAYSNDYYSNKNYYDSNVRQQSYRSYDQRYRNYNQRNSR